MPPKNYETSWKDFNDGWIGNIQIDRDKDLEVTYLRGKSEELELQVGTEEWKR